MSIPLLCASSLREVMQQLRFWKQTAPELPVRLEHMLETARAAHRSTPEANGSAAGKLVAALEVFEKATDGGDRPNSSAVVALYSALENSYGDVTVGHDESPRSLATDRHTLVNTLLPLLSAGETLKQQLQTALATLEDDDKSHPLAADLQRCLDVLAEDVTTVTVDTIAGVLAPWRDEIEASLPPVPVVARGDVLSAPLKTVLIVEDQSWGNALEEQVCAALPQGVAVLRARTLAEASVAIDAFPLQPAPQSDDGKSQTDVGPSLGQVLVFLDLGLPEDEAALQAGLVSRAHGKQLLERLRAYQLNVPTIVLTTPSEYMPDHLWIAQRGVSPEDFILKTDRDWRSEVDEALRRALERRRTVHGVKLDKTNRNAWIDGIPVRFGPLDFKIVTILCEDLKDKPAPQHRRHAFSCSELAEQLELYYGEECAPENMPAHIHTIRCAIHGGFNEAGRIVNARRIVATVFHEDEVRYQMIAGHFLNAGESAAPVVSKVTVLVVEDDAAWRDAIAEPLRAAGYEVETAGDVATAIRIATELSPTVLCVDMQLPVDAGAATPAIDDKGGLRVIEQVREIDPETRAVVLTDRAQHDQLRVEATRRGVWIHDYIHKAGPDRMRKLHRSIWRLAREWQQGIDLSQSALHDGHVVELSRSQPRELWVDGIPLSVSKGIGKLIQSLAAHVDERIAAEDLQAMVYGDNDNEDRSNSLVQLIKYARKQIETTAQEAGCEVNAKHIIAEESGGYILCGPVTYRE